MLFLRCLCELLSDLKKQTRAEATLCSHKLFRLQTKNREKSFLPPTSSTPSRSMSLVKFDIWPVNVDRLPLTWPRPEPSPPSHDDILADRGRKTHQKVREGGGTGLAVLLWPKQDQDPSSHEVWSNVLFGSVLFVSWKWVEVSADPSSFNQPEPG